MAKAEKQRITPLTKTTTAILQAWLVERGNQASAPLLPTSQGRSLSRDALEQRLAKHTAAAA